MRALRTIPLDQIDPPEEGLRATASVQDVQGLAQSIQELGLLQPVGVVKEGDRYRLCFGQRRYLAHQWLGRTSIECRVMDADAAKELASSVAENLARRDLNPVEEARACRAMVDGKGMTVREIAQATSRSESWVRVRLDLLLWPEHVVEAVRQGELTVSVARELMVCEEELIRNHYLRCALESGCTAAQMRLWVTEWEVSRGSPAVEGEAARVASTFTELQIPTVGCAMCRGIIPVTEVRGLRVCGGCAAELVRAVDEQATPQVDGADEDGG